MENQDPKEELIQRQRSRLAHLRSIQIGKQGRQTEIANPRTIISQAVKREYPDLDQDEVQKTTRELVLAPNNSRIKVGEQEVPVEDLQFKIAESIELLNSQTNSTQEYFSWFEDCARIVHNMNDGYISDSDLTDRNSWIDSSYIREAELMTCLGLYKNSAFPEAKERYNQIYNKLVKLRQLRNAIKECTGNASDETRERTEKIVYMVDPRTAVQYLMVIQQFQQHNQYWNMSEDQLRRLHMYRGYDDELDGEYGYFYGRYEPEQEPGTTPPKREGYPFMDKIKEYILFHWDDVEKQAPTNSYGEQFRQRQQEDSPQNKDDIKSRINDLRNRRHNDDSNVERRIKSFMAARFRNIYGSNTK